MFGIIAPIVGAAVGIYGANKQANAAKDAQQERNNATEAQYQYNKERWEMDKQKMLADRDYKVQEIEERARQEGQLAAFKDASNARQYNYQLQIRNKQQDTNERMFAKSDEIFRYQLGMNAMEERAARMDERQQLQEIHEEKRYEKNGEKTPQYVWAEAYRWWFQRIKFRRAQKTLDFVEAGKIKDDMSKRKRPDGLQEYVDVISGEGEKEEDDGDASDPYGWLKQYHNLIVRFMQNPNSLMQLSVMMMH